MRLHFRFFQGQKPESEPDHLMIAGEGEPYRIELRRHAAARRYTLRVRETSRDIVLTMPPRGSLRQAKNFAEKNAGWIAARLKRLPGPIAFVDGATIPLRGEPHKIAHRQNARGTVWIEPGESGPLLCVAGKEQHLARRLRDFLKAEAKRDLAAASRKYAALLGVTIRSISVRDTASRWGSCSYQGALSYSWRLIFAPPFVLDYLAAHELAHRLELNHSKRYWKIVDGVFTERKRAESWLRANGAQLHRYGAS
ncbi:MAG TPA: SprT family zinc-dependent metalloprotease [Xanthobacteraceae bacterium]|jgi:predicted metal-dependent hydrolase|nr:SprT family zinc-dependent metalloprotease [Xanthobacteraceae bacterium]